MTAGEYRGEPKSVALAMRKRDARAVVVRETHAMVLRVTEDRIPSEHYHWWADLRRGQLRIYGGLLRFLDQSHAMGVAQATLQRVPSILSAYIRELFGG